MEGGNSVLKLSGRNPHDHEFVEALPEMGELGIVIIDDFHRLSESIKFKIADFIKLLADTENTKSKVIVVGINKVGQSLVNYASDLTGRIDTISFESNPDEKVKELIEKGESALNISIKGSGNFNPSLGLLSPAWCCHAHWTMEHRRDEYFLPLPQHKS